MKKIVLGVLGFVLLGTLTACPPARPTPVVRGYGVADFPMKVGENWGVVFQVGDQKPAVTFQLAAAPVQNKNGDVSASLKVSGANATGGVAYIANVDDTFNVGIKISSFTFSCYATVRSNWSSTVRGTGFMTDGQNPSKISCAMSKLANLAVLQ